MTRPRQRPVILIVDDDGYVLDLVARVLKPINARLVPATSAAAARIIAGEEALALAIVDIGLREGGEYGYRLSAELRAIQAATGRNLTVIALTGQMPDPEAVAAAGITATVGKPFQLAEFRALVSAHLAAAAEAEAAEAKPRPRSRMHPKPNRRVPTRASPPSPDLATAGVVPASPTAAAAPAP